MDFFRSKVSGTHKRISDSTRPAECLKRPTTSFKAYFERSNRRSLDKGVDIKEMGKIFKYFKVKEIKGFCSRGKTFNEWFFINLKLILLNKTTNDDERNYCSMDCPVVITSI